MASPQAGSQSSARRTVVAAPRTWEWKEGFNLSGTQQPEVQLHPTAAAGTSNAAAVGRSPSAGGIPASQVDPLTELHLTRVVDANSYSVMKHQQSATCRKNLNTVYVTAADRIREIIVGMHLDRDVFSSVGIVTRVPEEKSDEGLPFWELSVFESVVDESDLEEELPMWTLRVWIGKLPRVCGVFVGSVVGIVGEVAQRDINHNIAAVTATDYILPPYAAYPWVAQPQPEAATASTSDRKLRVQCCSGPYPPASVNSILQSLIQQAKERSVDVLVIAGPLVEEPLNEEMMDDRAFGDIENEITTKVQDLMAQSSSSRLKIVFVPSVRDVTTTPILPQLAYDYEDDDRVMYGTNPSRITCDGISIGLSTFDAVSHVAEHYFERGQVKHHREQRIAEAVVRSGLYTPLAGLKTTHVDLAHLPALALTSPSSSSVAGNAATTTTTTAAGGVLPHIVVMFSPRNAPWAHNVESSRVEEYGPLVVNCGRLPATEADTEFSLYVSEITIPSVNAVLANGPRTELVSVLSIHLFKPPA